MTISSRSIAISITSRCPGAKMGTKRRCHFVLKDAISSSCDRSVQKESRQIEYTRLWSRSHWQRLCCTAPKDTYDVVLVTVRKDQLASILPMLANNHQIPTVLFMLNNPLGIQRYEIIEPQRVVLGFPSVGGTRQGEVIRYILIRQQQTTLGEVDGRVTPRLQQLATAFKKAGFSVDLSPDMQAWLKTHAIFVSCISAALATTEGDSVRLGHTRESVVMMVQAIREGFMALKAQGTPISPFNLKVLFLRMPRWFAVLYWQYALRTTVGTLAIAPHANAARDEMCQVARDIMAQLQTSSVSTPTLRHLLAFLDAPA